MKNDEPESSASKDNRLSTPCEPSGCVVQSIGGPSFVCAECDTALGDDWSIDDHEHFHDRSAHVARESGIRLMASEARTQMHVRGSALLHDPRASERVKLIGALWYFEATYQMHLEHAPAHGAVLSRLEYAESPMSGVKLHLGVALDAKLRAFWGQDLEMAEPPFANFLPGDDSLCFTCGASFPLFSAHVGAHKGHDYETVVVPE